jgi:NAD-specific glutamate dehydrogenase
MKKQETLENLKNQLKKVIKEHPIDVNEDTYWRGVKIGLETAIEVVKLQEQDKNKYSEEEMLEFSEWVSHNDWVYLPSKGYWVNEEVEESEEKFTTKELFKQFKNK